MKNRTYLKWTTFHNNPNARKQLPDIIFNSWERSYAFRIDNNNSIPSISKKKELNYNKEKWELLHFYANGIISKTIKNFNTFNIGIALFDNDAYLTKLYGDNNSIEWLEENNIKEKSIWTENTIGTNAVSLGLKLKIPISVIGEEHFSKFAIKFAMYFSPIILEKNLKNSSNYGGIAIITPVENKNHIFLITANIIAKSIALYFDWFELTRLFINSVNGYLIINQSNNKNKIVYISEQTCKLLKISFDTSQGKSLEEIIDPYPENKTLWNILSKEKKFENIDINISLKNEKITINLSTYPFYDKSHNIKGISVILNSYEKDENLKYNITKNNTNITFSDIIGKDKNFLNVLNKAKAAAKSNINVLLLGESGVGKDIVAQSIHNASERKNKPFIVVNCAALPKELVASELFGYEKGAFTGAKKEGNIGKFELANHGTIFLDEIGDIPLDIQAILLRVIEQKKFMKLGSNSYTDVDVRIIAATNKNLIEKIKKGEFREDLFYRLGIIRLTIPPLRDRKDDILLLSKHFIEKICKKISKPLVTLSPETKIFFTNYHWPGNVRELKNMLEGIIQIYDSPVITYEHIENYMINDSALEKNIDSNQINKALNIKATIPDSKEYIIHALEYNKNNKTNTAKYLGISRNTLYRRLKKYDLL